jgi:uncharacterized membrane protein YuzA (DUF378 family)
MTNQYMIKLAHKIAIVYILVGAIVLGISGATKVNVLDKILGKNSIAARMLCISIGLSALSVAFNRDTYLPFLGESVFPCSVLGNQVPPGATRSIEVRVQPDSKVVYWASEPGSGQGSWDQAYLTYQNAGVTTSDSSGIAILKVREPQGYSVPIRGPIETHIHFRVCGQTGFVGRIKTVYLADGRVEGFRMD